MRLKGLTSTLSAIRRRYSRRLRAKPTKSAARTPNIQLSSEARGKMEARNACLIFERYIFANEVLQLPPAIQVRILGEKLPAIRVGQPPQYLGVAVQRTSPGEQSKHGGPEQETKNRSEHRLPRCGRVDFGGRLRALQAAPPRRFPRYESASQ